MASAKFYYISKSGSLESVATVADAIKRSKQEGFFWLHYVDPTIEDLQPLIEQLGLHMLSIEDVMDTNQIPKINDYSENAFIIFDAFSYHAKQLDVHDIGLFLSNHFLVSVDHLDAEGNALLSGIEEIVTNEMVIDRFGPSFVMHTILDTIVDRKFVVIEALEDELAEAESAALERNSEFDPMSLQHIRRALVTLRKCLFHEREVFVKICRKDCPFIPDKAIFHYRDVYDHLTRFFELTETLRDVATSLMEIDLSLRSNEMARAANRTNNSVRRLTFITTIFMPLTLLAGVGGMSEWSMMTGPTHWRYTYPLFLLGMAVIGSLTYMALKRIVKRDDQADDE